jgi:hypothetical protein
MALIVGRQTHVLAADRPSRVVNGTQVTDAREGTVDGVGFLILRVLMLRPRLTVVVLGNVADARQ